MLFNSAGFPPMSFKDFLSTFDAIMRRRCPDRRSCLGLTGFLIVIGLIPGLFAQVPAKRGGVHFRTLGWGVAPNDVFYSLDGRDVGVKIFDSARSGFQVAPKQGNISFYRIVKKENGEMERIIIAQADLSGTGPTPLLFVRKNEANPEKLDIKVIPDDLNAFPEQTCRFVNFTPIEIGVTMGPETSVIPPGGIRLMNTELEEDDLTRYVTVFVKVKYEKLMLSYNNWVFRPGQRVMVFISVDKEGQPRVVRLVDAVASLAPFHDLQDSR